MSVEVIGASYHTWHSVLLKHVPHASYCDFFLTLAHLPQSCLCYVPDSNTSTLWSVRFYKEGRML